jgi:hypothetical protein
VQFFSDVNCFHCCLFLGFLLIGLLWGCLEFKACGGCICIDYHKFFGFRIVIVNNCGKNDSCIGEAGMVRVGVCGFLMIFSWRSILIGLLV